MPTGYTAPVQSGEITEFKDYALVCARAFGAAIHQKEDSLSAPLKTKVDVDPYYVEKVAEAEKDLADLQKRTTAEWKEALKANYAARVRFQQAQEERRITQLARYQAMLEKARAWKPPSKEHQELKNFMVSQLTESMDFDCTDHSRPIELLSVDDFRRQEIRSAVQNVEYYRKRELETRTSAEKATLWLTELVESL